MWTLACNSWRRLLFFQSWSIVIIFSLFLLLLIFFLMAVRKHTWPPIETSRNDLNLDLKPVNKSRVTHRHTRWHTHRHTDTHTNTHAAHVTGISKITALRLNGAAAVTAAVTAAAATEQLNGICQRNGGGPDSALALKRRSRSDVSIDAHAHLHTYTLTHLHTYTHTHRHSRLSSTSVKSNRCIHLNRHYLKL